MQRSKRIRIHNFTVPFYKLYVQFFIYFISLLLFFCRACFVIITITIIITVSIATKDITITTTIIILKLIKKNNATTKIKIQTQTWNSKKDNNHNNQKDKHVFNRNKRKITVFEKLAKVIHFKERMIATENKLTISIRCMNRAT